jgi:MFS family permease
MDLAYESVGSNGKFQKITSVLVIVVASMTLFMSISFPFLTYKPEILCHEKDNFITEFHHCHEEELCKYDMYEYMKVKHNSLDNWAYEFDLYCEKSYFNGLIGTTFFFGGMTGSILLSPIPDKYGRASIYKILLTCSFVLHICLLFSFSAVEIVFLNFLCGVAGYAYSMSTLIITEYIDRKTAGTVMSINNAIFPMSGILCALFFMFINNWRILFGITSLISLLVVLVARKYFLESPRWLNSKNRLLECLQVLKKIAELNGNEVIFQKFLEVNSSKFNYINIFRSHTEKCLNVR